MKNALSLISVGFVLLAPVTAAAQVSVAVDPTMEAHAISPLIYGMNFATGAQISQGKIPLTRWGGNSTTRYNYEIDVTNTAADYFFEDLPGCWGSATNCSPPPTDPKTNSGANAFLAGARQNGISALFTIPTMGFVAKAPATYAHPFPCGCPKTASPAQDSFDPYDSNCGNGKSGGNWITCPDPTTTTSVAITPQWAHDWVAYLVGKFGPSNGKVIYELDNEPGLWSSTQHDAHPSKLSYDELWQRMRDYAIAIRQADPTALVAGFEEWGWPNYFCSDADDVSKGCTAASPDRAAHGGVELTAWILDQAKAYESANGKRILDYLDLHYYPQDANGHPPDTTRSLWDPSYTDPSWINDKIRLVPRMRDWVSQHYPGTKIGVSEYDWGSHNTAAGAIAYAEVLGIFGRESLDYATAWSPPAETDAAFAAYKLFTNYDGQGGHFGSVSVHASVTGAGAQAFAAVTSSRMTVALVNENASATSVTVTLGNFQPGGAAHYFERSTGAALLARPDITPSGGTFTVPMSAATIGMLVIDGTNPNGLPDAGAADAGGNPSSDSGVSTVPVDGGTPVSGNDGGPSNGAAPSSGASGGCGCRMAPPATAASLGLCGLLAGLAATFVGRRRRN